MLKPLALCLLFAGAVSGQQALDLPPYWGERLIRHDELRDWFESAAHLSPRVALETYGRSEQGRELFCAVVSSPANIARLETHRAAARALRSGAAPAAGQTAIVWLGYSIHGNELSSTEAAVKMLHRLATGADEETMRILDRLVVVIDPLMNPDGRARFIAHERSASGPRPARDPQALEHDEGWPSGRTNHYLFDLNRDWFLLSQVESRRRAAAILRWSPQVFVDHHEMGSDSSYFFPPPAEPFCPWMPELARTWYEKIGSEIAADFDARGWSYWTKEVFDLFYPGYGGSWPSYLGAVAMTFEQASARGRAIERNDGTVLTLKDGAEHHFVAGLATLRVAAQRRDELLRAVAEHFGRAREQARADRVKAYVLAPCPRPDATERLVRALLRQGIEVRRSPDVVELDRLVPLTGGERRRRSLPAGTFAVPTDQPLYHLVQVLLAPDVPIDAEFLAKDAERVAKGERSFIYDVTAWSMALTYGVEAYAAESALPDTFAKIEALEAPAGGVEARSDAFAWLISSHEGEATRILPELARRDVKARVATFPFKNEGRSFPAGTVVVLRGRNEDDAESRLAAAARAAGVEVVATATGRNEDAFDLGSNRLRPFVAPRIALLGGPPARAYSFGAARYYLERVLGADFVMLRAWRLSGLDLTRYDVIVLPDGREWKRWLTAKGVGKLKAWVDAGGVLVTLAEASSFLAEGEKPWLKTRRAENPGPARCRGPLVRLEADERHWLAYGLPSMLVGQLRSGAPLLPYNDEAKKPTGRNVVRLSGADSLRISGLMGEDLRKLRGGSLFVGAERHGRGLVVPFAEDVLVRANMVGTMPLFANAVMLGPTFAGR